MYFETRFEKIVVHIFFLFIADCEEMEGLDFARYITCMTDSYGQYVLHQAARQGNLDLVKHLHRKGKDLNQLK